METPQLDAPEQEEGSAILEDNIEDWIVINGDKNEYGKEEDEGDEEEDQKFQTFMAQQKDDIGKFKEEVKQFFGKASAMGRRTTGNIKTSLKESQIKEKIKEKGGKVGTFFKSTATTMKSKEGREEMLQGTKKGFANLGQKMKFGITSIFKKKHDIKFEEQAENLEDEGREEYKIDPNIEDIKLDDNIFSKAPDNDIEKELQIETELKQKMRDLQQSTYIEEAKNEDEEEVFDIDDVQNDNLVDMEDVKQKQREEEELRVSRYLEQHKEEFEEKEQPLTVSQEVNEESQPQVQVVMEEKEENEHQILQSQ